MKTLLSIISIVLLYSCQPRIKNDVKTVEKVFAMPDFDIEIQVWGCFGGFEEHFSVQKKNNKYLLKSNRTGESHFVSEVKMDSLKNYLKIKIGKEDNGGCTTSEFIRLGSFFNSIDYQHSHCDGTEATIINDLLGYRDLINRKENAVSE